MKPKTHLLALVHTGAVTASFFHWGHHDEHYMRHYKYSGPFGENFSPPEGFVSLCEAEATFKAKEYSKEDLRTSPPLGLSSWAPALEIFLAGRQYAGHWKGLDDHGDEKDHRREYLVMEYTDVPRAVRRWIEDHQRKGTDTHKNWMFAVLEKPKGGAKVSTTLAPPEPSPAQGAEGNAAGVASGTVRDKDKILFFAAGSIFEIAPLWVAEGSKCEGETRPYKRALRLSCSTLTTQVPFRTSTGTIRTRKTKA